VSTWYFEEVLLEKKKQKELIKPTECSGVLVECEEVTGVSVNVCEGC